MRHVVQRLGFRITRGWAALLLAVGALVATAFWIGPFRPLPPELNLLALGSDGEFRDTVGFAESSADTAPPQPDVPARFPLVLAVHNSGARSATPRHISINVPTKYRLANSEGMPYEGRLILGNPLAQYVFDVNAGAVRPGQMPRLLSTIDTLWLEPLVPSYYCTAMDSVPEFIAAPPQDPAAFSDLRIFYSFDANVRDRQTGLLTIKLPPRLLTRVPVPPPPQFPMTVYEPEAPRPVLGEIGRVGERNVRCGDVSSNMELLSVLWQTAEGGRFFVVHYGGAPRKYLYDLDRDSIIELEIWDSDSDGVFESSRPARMLIPEFLMPPRPVARPVEPPHLATADSAHTDSTGAATATATAPAPAAAPARSATRVPPAVFHNTDDGPFRFWRAEQRTQSGAPDSVPRRRPVPRDTTPRVPVVPPVDTVRRDTILPDTFLRRDTLVRRDTLR